MSGRLSSPELRAELRSVLWAARAAGADPLRVLGTYAAMRLLDAETASALGALLGPGKLRTAQRRRTECLDVVSATNLTFCPEADARGGDRRPSKTTGLTHETTGLTHHSLLSESDDVDSRQADAGSAGGEEARVPIPSARAEHGAARNLRAKGVPVPCVREALAYARDKWPTVKLVREGRLRNEGGYLSRMVEDYARRRGWLASADFLDDDPPASARPSFPEHRRGPPCPHCAEPTETGRGACGNVRCSHALQVVTPVG